MSQREHKTPLILPNAGAGIRLAVVRAECNSAITTAQKESAKQCAAEYAVACDFFDVAGAFELPQLIDQLVRTKQYDGFVAVGCLIKGETTHFEVISEAVSSAIMQLSLTHHIPIGFGVITALTQQQAADRVWIGYDATYAVLQTLSQLPRT